jgi:Flp pilus assembly pilin Flp
MRSIFRRSARSRRGDLTIEYTLIAVVAAYAVLQILLTLGAKAGSI